MYNDLTDNHPTHAQLLVSQLTHKGKSDRIGGTQSVTARLHLDTFCMIEAMAEQAGLPRTQIMNQLLGAGIDVVSAELPNKDRLAIEENAAKMLRDMAMAQVKEASQ